MSSWQEFQEDRSIDRKVATNTKADEATEHSTRDEAHSSTSGDAEDTCDEQSSVESQSSSNQV